MEDIFNQILQGAENSSPLELFAVVFGLLSVWYARSENILVFPTGIVNVGIFIFICAKYKLYADMGINLYYLTLSIYGWIMWSKKKGDKKLVQISWGTSKENLLYILAALFFIAIIYFILTEYTDSDVPLWDSITTGIFIVGMILMARKKIENWIAWIIGDLISIPLYLYKGLAFTSFQYLAFTVLAVMGLIEWRKLHKNDKDSGNRT